MDTFEITLTIETHYREHFHRLCILFSNRAGGLTNAEDVVQEAYCRALKFRKSFDGSQDFDAWFNTILNHALHDAKQAERRMGMSVAYNEDMDDTIDMMEWEHDMVKKVKEDICKKSSPVRQVLQLYFFNQYKPREISQVLDMSNAYVRTIAKEFKQELRAKYGDVFE